MKKVVIVLKDITESGGGERVCVNLANALVESNVQVSIVSLFRQQDAPVYNISSNVELIYVSNKSATTKNIIKKIFYKTLYRIFLSYKTHNIIENLNASSVVGNDGWFMPYWKVNGVKYIRLWHLNAPKKRHKNLVLFNTLVILSANEMDTWQTYHNDIKVIPNFLPNISDIVTDYNQKMVISVGRFTHEKGFLRLIDIWKIIRNNEKYKDWKLTIVGDGVMKKEIEEKININNLQDSIILEPFTKNIESKYLQASIYAMTSYFEGFGMVLAEASSYGLPCIAFDIATGPSDIIADRSSGYLIEDNNLCDFATKLQDLMSNRDTREIMGVRAKQRVKDRFSKDNVIKLWLDIL